MVPFKHDRHSTHARQAGVRATRPREGLAPPVGSDVGRGVNLGGWGRLCFACVPRAPRGHQRRGERGRGLTRRWLWIGGQRQVRRDSLREMCDRARRPECRTEEGWNRLQLAEGHTLCRCVGGSSAHGRTVERSPSDLCMSARLLVAEAVTGCSAPKSDSASSWHSLHVSCASL